MRWAYVGGIALLGCTFVADIWLPVDYRVAANVSLIYVAALATIFILLYGLRSNWRANHIGRTLFAKSIVLPFVLWQIVLATWWDTDFPVPAADPVRHLQLGRGGLSDDGRHVVA
jgi:hypothetical protein